MTLDATTPLPNRLAKVNNGIPSILRPFGRKCKSWRPTPIILKVDKDVGEPISLNNSFLDNLDSFDPHEGDGVDYDEKVMILSGGPPVISENEVYNSSGEIVSKDARFVADRKEWRPCRLPLRRMPRSFISSFDNPDAIHGVNDRCIVCWEGLTYHPSSAVKMMLASEDNLPVEVLNILRKDDGIVGHLIDLW